MRIVKYIPRIKEGGVFVRFEVGGDPSIAAAAAAAAVAAEAEEGDFTPGRLTKDKKKVRASGWEEDSVPVCVPGEGEDHGEPFEDAEDVAQVIARNLAMHPRHAFLTPKPIHVHLVKGTPWMDDILNVFPSSQIKIELRGTPQVLSELTREALFEELRAFGQMSNLVLNPYEKDKPRTGMVQYRRLFSAVSAVCMYVRSDFKNFLPSRAPIQI